MSLIFTPSLLSQNFLFRVFEEAHRGLYLPKHIDVHGHSFLLWDTKRFETVPFVWSLISLIVFRRSGTTARHRMANASERERLLTLMLENRGNGAILLESSICAFIVLSAFLGNTLLCLSLYKMKEFQVLRPQNSIYIKSLAVSDLLFGALCMSFSFGALIRGKWVFGDTVCQFQGSLMFISVIASLITMTLIAINRYFKICQPINIYRKVYTGVNVKLSIILTWVVSTALVVALFSFTNRPFRFHPGKCNCFLNYAYKSVHLYTLCAYTALCIVTFPVITFCYFKVYIKVREHFAEIAQSEATKQEESRSFINEARITKMLFVTLVAFLVCWTPSVCVDIFEGFHEYRLPRQVYLWQVMIFACSSAINPVIYGFMRKELRIAYKRILTCRL